MLFFRCLIIDFPSLSFKSFAVKNHGAENHSQVNMWYNTIRSTRKAKRIYRRNHQWSLSVTGANRNQKQKKRKRRQK